MSNKITHDEFIARVASINDKIEIVSQYISSNKRVRAHCLVHDDYYWDVFPVVLLRGGGCPKCSNKYRRTHDDFVCEMRQINCNIEILSVYTNNKCKIKCRCLLDGREWEAKAQNLLHGSGCPECGRRRTIAAHTNSHEDFVKRMKTINENIEIIGIYTHSHKHIECRCLVCNNEWETSPTHLLSGSGCPKCFHRATGDRCRLPHDVFISLVNDNNPNVEVLSKYVNNHQTVKYRCKKCDNIYWSIPRTLMAGGGCPICSMSKGEKRIANYLENQNIEYIYEKEYDGLIGTGGGNLSYDFFLPEYNMLIEYQGQFHDLSLKSEYYTEENLERQAEHDSRKRQYANEHYIDLLEIWYWDYGNIESILENKLSA